MNDRIQIGFYFLTFYCLALPWHSWQSVIRAIGHLTPDDQIMKIRFQIGTLRGQTKAAKMRLHVGKL